MGGRKKFVAGWTGSRPPWAADWAALSLDRLRLAGRPHRHGTTLILGPDTLRRVTPDRVQKILRFPYGVAVGLAGAGVQASTGSWADANVALVETDAALRARLETFDSLPARVQVASGLWVPAGTERDPVLANAVSVLPNCGKIDIENWSAEFGVERHFLNRRFQRVLHISAQEVCRDYLAEYVDRERERGITWPLLAAALGFPDPKSLRRAATRPRVPRELREARRMVEVPD